MSANRGSADRICSHWVPFDSNRVIRRIDLTRTWHAAHNAPAGNTLMQINVHRIRSLLLGVPRPHLALDSTLA